MVKAYLRYEQVAAFGVVASPAVAARQLPSDAHAPLIATAAVDTLVVWNLRTGEAVVRFGNAATRKAGAITALAVPARGDVVACGYADGSVRVWRVEGSRGGRDLVKLFGGGGDEPQPMVVFNGHRSGVSALTFESLPARNSSVKSGKDDVATTLVSGSNDGDVIVWSLLDTTGKFRLSAHNDAITALLYFRRRGNSGHVDGSAVDVVGDANAPIYIVSASKDGLVKVFDAVSQHCIQTIAQHRAEVWAMQLDPTLNLLLTASVGAEIRVFSLSNSESAAAGVSRSGEAASTTGDDLLNYDAENIFSPLGYVERHTATNRVAAIECTAHGGECFAVVCAADRNAEIFRFRNEKQAEVHRKRRQRRKIAAIEKEVGDLAADEEWDEEEKQAQLSLRKKDVDFSLSAEDFLVSVRQIKVKKKLRSISFLRSHTYIPMEKGAGVQLQLLVQQRDNALEIHNANLKSAKERKRRKKGQSGAEEDADGEMEDEGLEEIKKILTLDFAGHRNDVRSVALSPDETTLLSTSDGGLKLWNVSAEKCIRTMKFTGYGLCTQFLGADGMVGVVGSKSGSVQVFELGSGGLITEEMAHEGEVWSMCLDNHVYEANCLITGGADKRVCFWNIADVLVGRDGKLELTRVLEMPDQVLCVTVAYGRESPILLVSLMDSTVRAYFLDSLEPYLTFYGHKLPVMSMDVSSDGLVLATGSADKTIKLWGMDFGDCRRSLRAHTDSVLSVAFQPKTHYLFSGSKDGSLKYWDGDKFEFICDIDGQRGEVWSLTLSADGEIVATASNDRMLRVWRRTDEPLFLDEERERRMDELFESKLVDEDLREASKAKKDKVGFMADEMTKESSAAGKLSMETVKGGEKLIEGMEMCMEEERRVAEGGDERPNPLLLGMQPEAYLLHTLEQIRSADLEEALHILPLDMAMRLLDYVGRLLGEGKLASRLVVEMLVKSGLYLVKLHHSQICAGAVSRKVVQDLYDGMQGRMEEARMRMGVNCAALHYWQQELEDQNDAAFRDASARAYNMERARMKKAKIVAKAARVKAT